MCADYCVGIGADEHIVIESIFGQEQIRVDDVVVVEGENYSLADICS